jgi:hypothetical protein
MAERREDAELGGVADEDVEPAIAVEEPRRELSEPHRDRAGIDRFVPEEQGEKSMQPRKSMTKLTIKPSGSNA